MKLFETAARVLLILSFAFLTINTSGQLKKVSKEHAKIMREYSDLYKKYQEIQKQASSDKELVAEGEKLKNDVEALMIKKDPSLKQVLDDRKEIEEKVDANPNMDKEELAKLHEQYQETSKILHEKQHDIMEQKKFKDRAEAISKKLRERMIAIDPNTPKIEEKLAELREKLNQTTK
ncbi:MAG: hypothetical protein QY331_01230 [Melioribacteraceae bacterium]|nr:MAG: hypothetical protein QY331_01230 [Melioribacteraceae bacterium]